MNPRHPLLGSLACAAMVALFTACPPAIDPDTSIAVESVSLDKPSLSLSVGASAQLSAMVSPADATDASVTWSSSDAAVASVSASGLVSAVAAGSAAITVTTTDGGKIATCSVTVSPVDTPVALVERTLGGTLSATLDGNAVTLNKSCEVIARDATGKDLATSGIIPSTAPWSLAVECPEGTEVFLYLSLWNEEGLNGAIYCDKTYRKTVTIGADDMPDIDLGPLDFVTLSGSVSVTHNGSPLSLADASINVMLDLSGTSSNRSSSIRTTEVNADGSWSVAILPPIGTENIYFFVSMGFAFRFNPEYSGYCEGSLPNDGNSHAGIVLSRAIDDFSVSGSAKNGSAICTSGEGWVVSAYSRAPTGDESIFDLPTSIATAYPGLDGTWSMTIPASYAETDLWFCLRLDAADGSAAAYFDASARRLSASSTSPIELDVEDMNGLAYCTISGTVSLGGVTISELKEYWIEARSKQDYAPDCVCYQNVTVTPDGTGTATWSIQIPKKQSAYYVFFRVCPDSGDYEYVDKSPRSIGAYDAAGITLVLSDMNAEVSGGL